MVEIKSPFLESCKINESDFITGPFVMVIFGANGDLSRNKLLPDLYRLFLKKYISKFSIICLDLEKKTADEYREEIRKAVQSNLKENEDSFLKDFSNNLFYEPTQNNYDFLCGLLTKFCQQNNTENIIYYLAVPTSTVPGIVEDLGKKNMCRSKKEAKIIIEKPFGKDLASAKLLNNLLLEQFEEKQIYRIDHYLGKESVQNLLFFRFSNLIFEPIWNRNYIDHIQITVAEDGGIGNRGAYYEKAGVIRDMVQNHIMQLLAYIAMESPVGFESDRLRDEKVKVLQSMRLMTDKEILANTVLGQYAKGDSTPSYREEKNVDPKSNVPTFFSGVFYVDNWRLAGVPFHVRTGKRMEKRVTEISVIFKVPPLRLLGRECEEVYPNKITFHIYPNERIFLDFNVKKPGMSNASSLVSMNFDYEKAFEYESISPYSRLIIDCIKNDSTLFARKDEVEALWSIVDPIVKVLERKASVHPYPPFSLGPKESDELMEKEGRKWNKY